MPLTFHDMLIGAIRRFGNVRLSSTTRLASAEALSGYGSAIHTTGHALTFAHVAARPLSCGPSSTAVRLVIPSLLCAK